MAEGLPYLNKTMLVGNLVRDPVLNYTQSGRAVCKMSVAVNRRYKGGNGEWQEDVLFIDLVVWGKQGENCQKYLSKGKKVFVEGRLTQNRWTAQDGTNRSKIEIVAERVQFLSAFEGPKPEAAPTEPPPAGANEFDGPAAAGTSNEAFSDDVPF